MRASWTKLGVEWILKPLVTAGLVVLLVATFSEEYSFSALRAFAPRNLSGDHDRRLSPALVAELRGGGFTLFIRHSSTDGSGQGTGLTAVDRASLLSPTLVPADFRYGLCLNELGRVESRLLGYFFFATKIPVGEVLSSPLCRARETAQLSIGRVDRTELLLVIDTALTDSERPARAAGLQRLLHQPPRAGTNRLLFSHASVLETQGYQRLGLERAGAVIFQHTAEGLKIRAVVKLTELFNALPLTPPLQP